MKVSVIVPSYNGAEKIPNILEALSKQSYQAFELILVLDGSTDNSKEVAEKFIDKFQNFKIIERENGGRAVVRNTGAKVASGDLLVFFDDDIRPTEVSLKLHTEHQTSHPNSILVGNVPEELSKMKTDIQKYRCALSHKWTKDFKKDRALDKNKFFLTAANLSVPKNIFMSLNGFDEKLKDSEDYDLGIKALKKSIPIYFDKDNIAWHDDFVTMKTYIKRQKQYKKSHEVLKELKPELYEEFNQYEFDKIGLGKKIIYGLFSLSFWVWTVDKCNWLKILPKKLRYKIYDIIITSKSVYFK